MKNPERPCRSMRKIDEYFIDYAREEACVKVANVKSAEKCSRAEGGRSLVPTRTPACTNL